MAGSYVAVEVHAEQWKIRNVVHANLITNRSFPVSNPLSANVDRSPGKTGLAPDACNSIEGIQRAQL